MFVIIKLDSLKHIYKFPSFLSTPLTFHYVLAVLLCIYISHLDEFSSLLSIPTYLTFSINGVSLYKMSSFISNTPLGLSLFLRFIFISTLAAQSWLNGVFDFIPCMSYFSVSLFAWTPTWAGIQRNLTCSLIDRIIMNNISYRRG